MNIQIFSLVGGNSYSTRPAFKKGIFVYTLVNFYNKANIGHLIAKLKVRQYASLFKLQHFDVANISVLH